MNFEHNTQDYCFYHQVIGRDFVCAKQSSSFKIHQEICLVYGYTLMSQEEVRQLCRGSKYGPTNVREEERRVRPNIQTHEIVGQLNW